MSLGPLRFSRVDSMPTPFYSSWVNTTGVPNLKNLIDHFLEEWFWRPAAIASCSFGRLSGTAAVYAWRNTLSEMSMVVISTSLTFGPIVGTLNEARERIGEAGQALSKACDRFADDLIWLTEAARAQLYKKKLTY